LIDPDLVDPILSLGAYSFGVSVSFSCAAASKTAEHDSVIWRHGRLAVYQAQGMPVSSAGMGPGGSAVGPDSIPFHRYPGTRALTGVVQRSSRDLSYRQCSTASAEL